jgi:Family of unknown function (DUF6049)
MPIVRTVVRTLIAGVLALVGTGVAGIALVEPALAVPAVQAHGQAQGSADADTVTQANTAAPGGVAVSIDSIGPRRYAYPGATITVSGTVTNDTGHPLQGMQVQLTTSGAFGTRSDLASFTAGQGTFGGSLILSAVWRYDRELHSGVTVRWTASFPAVEAEFTVFGVYPLDAQATSATSEYVPQGNARTVLPYWPDSGSGSGSAGSTPQKLDISWVWPLIDKPQQGVCKQDLATNELATSLAPGGRLNGLLAAGLQYSPSSQLTWAADPALLSDATLMTSRYKVGGDPVCTETTAMPASHAAATWLAGVSAAAGTDPMFLTPYADPDVSALSHAGLDDAVAESYSLGNSVAGRVLRKSFGSGSSIAWPDGGAADSGALTTLAREGHVSTTVLSSTEMKSTSFEDNAVAHVTTGIGTPMNVLLADSQITGLLGSATAASSAGTQFAVEQDFLAETAQIVAEAPNAQRSVVIAPPSRWDPSETEAATLLSLTSSPWLHPVQLASLATDRSSSNAGSSSAAGQLPASQLAPQELGTGYMRKVAAWGQLASDYSSSAPTEAQALSVAVAVTQSAAWRGTGSAGGWAALAKLENYITGSEKQVRIVSGDKVLLAGTSGQMSVSVENGLSYAVEVRVHASVPPGSQLTVSNPDQVVSVPANEIKTVRLKVQSAALGSALLQLELLTQNGVQLAGQTQRVTVETTRYGAALLILIAAALGVLVLTAMARWIRRWLRDGGSGHHVSGRSDTQESVKENGSDAGGTGAGSPGINSAGVSNAGVSGVGRSSAISGQRASRAGGGSGGTG